MSRHLPVLAGLVLALALAVRSPALSVDRLTIYTTNYPLQYFTEQIAGEYAEVVFPAPPDGDPAFWMPDGDTIAAYQQADLILLNGAGYEKWVNKVSLPQARLVDTSKGSRDHYITMAETVTHSHGAAGEHEHSNIAFTTWLDFTLAAEQARAIAKALGRKRPRAQDTLARNLAALEADLMGLDADLREMAARDPSRPLLGSHLVYQYLARRYGLNLRSVHWEPDETPSMAQWEELKNLLRHHPAQEILWEGEPLPPVVAELEKLGIRSIVFDPCANRPEQGNFLDVMRSNVKALDGAF